MKASPISSTALAVLLAALAAFSPSAQAADVTLIGKGAEWKYLDDNSDPGTVWKESFFNDSSWIGRGPAPLGYGDPHIVTTVAGGPSTARYITTYFRRAFTVSDPATISALRLNLLRDDGVVIYLNGTEISRDNLPTPSTRQTLAPINTSGTDETTYFPLTAASSVLVAGVNVLAVELHQNSTNSSDLGFDLEVLGTVAETGNAAPTVSLTAPLDGASFTNPPSIELAANASDTDGTVVKVAFYRGGTKIGETASAPFEFTWNNPVGGTHQITAIATDNGGVTAISNVANITVTAPANQAPSVSILAPTAGTFDAPWQTEMEVSATDADGVVSKVEFYVDGVKKGESLSEPFELVLPPFFTGSYVFTARAIDNDGGQTDSAAVTVVVENVDNVSPSVSLTAPVNGATVAGTTVNFTANASDTDGRVSKVEFYEGSNKLGEDTTAPYAYAWSGVAPGSYSLTAKAIDNDGGVSTSNPASITVSAPTSFSYTQNFNSLGSAGTAINIEANGTAGWSVFGSLGGGNSTWTTSIPASGTTSAATAGSLNDTVVATSSLTVTSNTAGYNFPNTSTTDRALGTSPTSGAGVALQLTLTNTAASGITSFNIGYDIVRRQVVTSANELPGYRLFYSLNDGVTWTNVAALNPAITGNAPTVIVPNTVGVTTVPATLVSLPAQWSSGASIRFRWIDDNAVATSPDQIHALDNVTITAASFAPGTAPAVALTAPSSGATYNPPATVSLAATASDSDGSVLKVEFYQGSTKIGEDTTAPYTFEWTNVPANTYSLTARAIDNDTNAKTSAPVSITVNAPPGSGSLSRSPYLNQASHNSIVVRWDTAQAVAGKVRYGTSPTNLNQTVDETISTKKHEVKLTGLSPYTRYYYSVGSAFDTLTPEAADTTSVRTSAFTNYPAPTQEDYTFRTSPLPGTAVNTRVWIVGDCGRGSSSQAGGRDAYYNFMGSNVPDLNLQMGDNAYNNGTQAEYQANYFLMYPTIFRKVPQWSCLGNHEATTDAATGNYPYFDMFTFPKAGECGGVASGSENYYSFDYGNIHFICLDSQQSSRAVDNPATTTVNEEGAMAAWLRADLAANTATWTIAFWHHPPYSKGSHDSDTEGTLVEMRQRFNPIMEAGGVDVLYFGHSHSYERSVLLNGNYGTTSSITAAMKFNAGNGSSRGFTTNGSGVIRRKPADPHTLSPAATTVNGTVIPPDGAYLKPLTGPRDNYGAVYNTAGSSGQADGGSLNHSAMYISYNTVGTVNLQINGNTLTSTYIQSGGTAPDNFTIVKQGAADGDGDGIADEYEIANGMNRRSASDAGADIDGDGLSGRVEFALGTQANVPTRNGLPLVTQSSGADSGKLALTFTPRQSSISYIVQASDDLKTWSDLAMPEITVGTPMTIADANTTSPNRYLRLKIVTNGVTDTLLPAGRIQYTLTQKQETSLSFPLSQPAVNISGKPAGFISAVGATTLDDASANWTPGALSNPTAPYIVRITKGAAAGNFFQVSTSTANTATSLTIITGSVNPTSLGIVAGVDTYELIPAQTLASLFPTGTLLSGSVTTGDTLRLWNGAAWVTYFHNGTDWMRQNGGVSNTVVVRPDQGWMLLRRGPSMSFDIIGQVPSTVGKATVQKGMSNFLSLLPVPQTFAEFPIQTLLPDWSSNSANVTAGDYVRIWNGAAWLNYYHNGTDWMRQNAGSANTTPVLRPGRPIFIVRPAGSGSNVLEQPKTY
ncbi:MAG TPA: Ig-like domain-containing protein [Chthoniobacterales bacterium]|jgi:hypothetical protein